MNYQALKKVCLIHIISDHKWSEVKWSEVMIWGETSFIDL